MKIPAQSTAPTNRRRFLKTSSTAVLGGALASQLPFPSLTTGEPISRKLKIGLIGCGGRGTGAANQALNADSNVELYALADVFEDPLQKSLQILQKQAGDKVAVPPGRCFVGFDAYLKVIDAVDVVLLGTPPHFRPMHLKACIDAGKHVFAEKPVAVDAPGVRSVLATTEAARKKNLSIVSGLCWRYEPGMQETIKRLQDGAIGDLVMLESTRYGGGVGKLAKREPGWSDMYYQMRNWYYYTWLSGDFIVEQFVHELDKMAWLMNDEYPVSCTATGGRIARIEPEYGHIYDHFNAIFEFANGVKYYAGTRHQPRTSSLWRDLAYGSKGRCDMMKFTITGANPWRGPKARANMHQLEHDAMYAALRSGQIINNGVYMAKSTMMAIMARMSAYTGKTLTWEEALNSKEDLTPPGYSWDTPLPEPPVARPGVTPFV